MTTPSQPPHPLLLKRPDSDPGFRHIKVSVEERGSTNGKSTKLNTTKYLRVPEAALAEATRRYAGDTLAADLGEEALKTNYRDNEARSRQVLAFLASAPGVSLHRDPAEGPALHLEFRCEDTMTMHALKYYQYGKPYAEPRPLWSLPGISLAEEKDAAPAESGADIPRDSRHLRIHYTSKDRIGRPLYGMTIDEHVYLYLLAPAAAIAEAEERWKADLCADSMEISDRDIENRVKNIGDFLRKQGAVLHRNPDAGAAYYRRGWDALASQYRLFGQPAHPTALGLPGITDVTPPPRRLKFPLLPKPGAKLA